MTSDEIQDFLREKKRRKLQVEREERIKAIDLMRDEEEREEERRRKVGNKVCIYKGVTLLVESLSSGR